MDGWIDATRPRFKVVQGSLFFRQLSSLKTRGPWKKKKEWISDPGTFFPVVMNLTALSRFHRMEKRCRPKNSGSVFPPTFALNLPVFFF